MDSRKSLTNSCNFPGGVARPQNAPAAAPAAGVEEEPEDVPAAPPDQVAEQDADADQPEQGQDEPAPPGRRAGRRRYLGGTLDRRGAGVGNRGRGGVADRPLQFRDRHLGGADLVVALGRANAVASRPRTSKDWAYSYLAF